MSEEQKIIINEANSSEISNSIKSKEGQQIIKDIIAPNKQKIIKVYLAILNNGNLRRDISASVIPRMQTTPGIKLVWEHPNMTWANPISSNRNKITKRFLETDCDFLLMIDDDVVPEDNPCELVFADKDIIGVPALVRSAGRIMVWTAYIPHSSGVAYSAVDLDALDDMLDIFEVAIVGTGCILIKRKVLETLKAPFHSEFDEDGIQKFGTDFAFCRKALKEGFHVYTTVQRRCEHYKTVGFSGQDAWDRIGYFDISNSPYEIAWGSQDILQIDWKFIKECILRIKPERILEFGCGLSSLLMSEFCDVTSFTTSEEHKKLIESKRLFRNHSLEIKLWDGKVCPDPTVLFPTKVDLVFIKDSRNVEAMEIASLVSDNVILYNAGRMREKELQREFLRSVFKLIVKSGNHPTRCNYWSRRPSPVTLKDVLKEMNKP